MRANEVNRDSLFDQVPCGLLVLDPTHAIVSANAYARRLLGRPPEGLYGLRFHTLMSLAGRVFVQSRIWPELALAGRVEEQAVDLIDGAGDRVPVLMNLTQTRDPQGQPADIQVAFTRAVAKRAYEAEVPRARSEAAAAARVKSDFLANISHELRTPLMGIIGGVDTLSGTELDDEQGEIVRLVKTSGQALLRIISDVLEMSRIDAGQLALETRVFDPEDELRGALDLVRLEAEKKGLDCEARFGPGLVGRLDGDPVRIRQVLGHLTSNAIKFTDRGGVRIVIDIVEDAGAVLLSIDVEDTGIGFDDAIGDVIFQRFHQAEEGLSRDRSGVGLGLSLTRAITDLMQGSIFARSTPGVGSLFAVRLPVRRVSLPAPVQPACEAPARETPGPPARVMADLKVLLVEDSAVNRKLVGLMMKRQGATVTTAENGLLGVEAWRSAAFDVVLMDIQMPVMDGLTAIREIRTAERAEGTGRHTPIAVLSANAMAHHHRESIKAGADIHISKPVTAGKLIDGILAAQAAH